ncbi:MAG: shikimate dehydrogenase [Nocardioides sp.]
MKHAVLGDPIAHSLSPVLHRAGYAELGLDHDYDAVRVPAGGLAAFFDTLDGGWRGLSLTMPLKREVLALVAEQSETVRISGAANTVLLADGERHLDNTDLPGAAAALRERYRGPISAITIVGAGATAASVGLALVGLGAERVRLLARSPERAAETAEAVRRHPAAPTVEVSGLDDAVTGEVVVSTVPAEAQDESLMARCLAVPVVFEVIYDPWPTPLAAAAIEAGKVLVGGLDLLVHQAALQFEMFTGQAAPLTAMRAAGERALTERSHA